MNDAAWSCLTARTHICQFIAPNKSLLPSLMPYKLWEFDQFIVKQSFKLRMPILSPRWLQCESFKLWELGDRGGCLVDLDCCSSSQVECPDTGLVCPRSTWLECIAPTLQSACVGLAEINKLCLSKQTNWVCIKQNAKTCVSCLNCTCSIDL